VDQDLATLDHSGKSHRDKGITKQGRRDLRFVLVEAARVAVQTHPYWKREFARLAKRIGDHKAVVAIARKLLIVVWHVLLAKSADRRADAEQVAFKLMVWSWKLNDEQRGGLRSRQFIRAHLIRLELGEELTHITRGGTKRGLATIEECWRYGQSYALHQTLREGKGLGGPVPAGTAYPTGQGQDERAMGRLDGGASRID
jgi:hypothetical protein